MPSILITGANRGIGLALAMQYASDGWAVHACCRSPDAAEVLRTLGDDIVTHKLDVKDRSAIAALAKSLDAHLDIVIANAGINDMPDDGSDPKKIGALDYARWENVVQVNLFGAMATCEAFIPHVKKTKGKLVSISSQLASNANAFFGSYAYNSSKAALNMAMNLLAIEMKPHGIAVGTLHPGWVQTDMGGVEAPVVATDSATGLRQVINDLKPNNRAHYLTYEGEQLPW